MIKIINQSQSGFTLIETLVAITLLTIAIVAPMALTAQSLSSAYYARDQITAYYLAQEAIEAVRAIRDNNILKQTQGTPTDLLEGIPVSATASLDIPFVIDTRDNKPNNCAGDCPALKTDGIFYAYGPVGTVDIYNPHDGWSDTYFTRTVKAAIVNGHPDEVKITVEIDWQTSKYKSRHFVIAENLYRWVDDVTTQQTTP